MRQFSTLVFSGVVQIRSSLLHFRMCSRRLSGIRASAVEQPEVGQPPSVRMCDRAWAITAAATGTGMVPMATEQRLGVSRGIRDPIRDLRCALRWRLCVRPRRLSHSRRHTYPCCTDTCDTRGPVSSRAESPAHGPPEATGDRFPAISRLILSCDSRANLLG
jgi:hypothetical protein